MDLSKDYILMCEEAEEIQEYWQNNRNDIESNDLFLSNSFFVGHKSEIRYCPKCRVGGDWFSDYCSVCGSKLIKKMGEADIHTDGEIWLPRQDQLQEMMFFKYPCWIGLLLFFSDWLAGATSAEDETSTPEQLWLAFCMYKLYQKIWDGKDWKEEIAKRKKKLAIAGR